MTASFPILSKMIHSKKMITDVIKTCDGIDTLNREERFSVFCQVCDNLLEEGRITPAKHKQWTMVV